MNYYNQYPMYNGYPNPYDTRGMMQHQTAQRCEIVRINGKNGADAYQLAPNSSALPRRAATPSTACRTATSALSCAAPLQPV